MISEEKKRAQAKEEEARQLLKEAEDLKSAYQNYYSHCQEIAERVAPSDSTLFNTSLESNTKGEKRTQELYDSTASIASSRFGAILDSLLTPKNSRWHRMATQDATLKRNREVQKYFEDVTDILFRYRYQPIANFVKNNQKVYKSIGRYGMGTNFVDELDNGPGIRYKNIHISQIRFAENHQGILDKAYRDVVFTARQAFQKFGSSLPEVILDTLKTKPEREFKFIHAVKPREDYDPQRKDAKGMIYKSCYVSVEGAKIVREQGYNSWPFPTSRYEQQDGEVTGRGPAMDVLPAIKTLNEQKKTILKQGHRALDPVILTHDDGVLNGIDLMPGAVNVGGVNSDGKLLVHTLPTGNIVAGKELMDDERKDINDSFLISLFQILVENPAMSATEVVERAKEKGILMAPTVGGIEDDYLGSLIEREIDLLSMQNLLPPMPQILAEAAGEYTVIYESPFAKMRRAEEASGLMRSVETALQVVNVTQNPEPLDHYDWDVIIPEISDIQGVPLRWMRDPKIIQQIRQSRAEQQQDQMEIQAAPAAAAMMKAQAVAGKKSAT